MAAFGPHTSKQIGRPTSFVILFLELSKTSKFRRSALPKENAHKNDLVNRCRGGGGAPNLAVINCPVFCAGGFTGRSSGLTGGVHNPKLMTTYPTRDWGCTQ